MTPAALIATKTAEILTSVGYPCTPAGDAEFLISRLDVRVDVVEGRTNEPPGHISLFPTIVTSHPHLPRGFARELAVGFGETMDDAVNRICATWMLLFFPPLKFLFEDHPHDCTVLVRDVPVPDSPDEAYRRVAGPVQFTGFQPAGDMIGQTQLWDCFSDLLLPRITHGVHHLRCFTGRAADGSIVGDVFLNGAEWPEGSERVREFARTLPEATAENPMVTVKQHLFLRPADLAASARRAQEEKLQVWHETLAPRIDPDHKPLVTPVLTALQVLSGPGTSEQHEQALLARGVDPLTAGRLINFLQSAAARVVLEGRLGFCDTYFLVHSKTDQAVERRYDQTPVFTACLQICTILHAAGLAQDEIADIASTSAEMNTIRNVAAQGAKLESARLKVMFHYTVEPVEGEPLNVLLDRHESSTPRPRKPWWRFW